MPPEPGDLDVDSAVDSFLADDGGSDDSTPSTTDDADDAAGAASGASDPRGDDDAGDDDEADQGGDAPSDDGEGKDDEPAKREPTALEKAIEAGDVRKFIEALGDKAETLLGGKAHRALRLQAQELTSQERRLGKAHAALKEEFGDRRAAKKAWESGNVDAFVDFVEKTTGASWADCEKAVHDSLAGRETRLQAKAKADEEAKAAADTKRAEHESALRTLITDTVKSSDAKLLEADPEIVGDVFRLMQTGWSRGINTPAKALAAWKKRLGAIAAVLAPAPATPPKRRVAPQIRPPRQVPQTERREPQDVDEMVDNFLREEGYHGR